MARFAASTSNKRAWMARLFALFTLLPLYVRTLRYVPLNMLLARLGYKARCVFYCSPLWGMNDLWHDSVNENNTELEQRPPLLEKGSADVGRQIAKGQWPLIGVTLPKRTLSDGRMDWRPDKTSALWQFTLHYFEWLADLRAAQQREVAQALVADWLSQYSMSWDKVAWHPYPTSVRIVSWLTHADWLLEGMRVEDRQAFFESLRRQVAHVAANVEHWGGGNHVIKNMRALMTAGCCLPGAEGYRALALALLVRELPKQVLPDGGHFERSVWYHALVLADLVAMQSLLKKQGGAPEILRLAVHKMGLALALMRHPDGGLGLFNDGAEGSDDAIERLLAAAGVADIEPAVYLPDTGYARLERGGTVVLCDVGKVGPDENPGHAHADTLSFEMSVSTHKGPQRLFVNGGTYAYQDRMRAFFRGTPAHTTVNVDGDNSAEVWSTFRVGRRPLDVEAELKDTKGGDIGLMGWHDGYRHKGVLHRRHWLLAADGLRLRGQDELVHDGFSLRPVKRRFLAHFLVHPAVRVTLVDDQTARLVLPGDGKDAWLFKLRDGGRMTCRETWYAPCFGEKMPTTMLVAIVRTGEKFSKLNWDLVKEGVG